MNHMRITVFVALLSVFGMATVSSSDKDSSYVWSQETESYRIYMEVVPAELVKNQPALLDKDKKLHAISVEKMPGLSHVLVWIYQKPGNTKALDLTVIAMAGPTDGRKVEKPLEKMHMKTGIAYGNVFEVHREEEHVVGVKIYAPNRSGYEEVIFGHDNYRMDG